METDKSKVPGFYCEVCDCTLKDSASFMDHKNGKKHLKNLGISTKKFTDSTLEEVKEMLRKKKEELVEKYEYEDDDEE